MIKKIKTYTKNAMPKKPGVAQNDKVFQTSPELHTLPLTMITKTNVLVIVGIKHLLPKSAEYYQTNIK